MQNKWNIQRNIFERRRLMIVKLPGRIPARVRVLYHKKLGDRSILPCSHNYSFLDAPGDLDGTYHFSRSTSSAGIYAYYYDYV